MITRQTNSVQTVLNKATTRLNKLQNYFSRVLTIFNIRIQTTKTRITNSTTITTVQKAELLDEIGVITAKHLPKFEETLKSLTNSKAAILTSQDHCLKFINSLRSSSVCYACSARASIFFTDGKLNMHENDCRSAIAECSDAWLSLANVFTMIVPFHLGAVDLGGILGITFTKFLASNPYDTFGHLVDEHGLMLKLTSCKSGDCSFEDSQEICDTMVSYQQPYYIEKALAFIGNNFDSVVCMNSTDQLSFAQTVTNIFNNEPIDPLLAKIAAMRKARLNPYAIFMHSGELMPILIAPPQDNQLLSSNFLYCQLDLVCVADKVVLTVSQCTLSTLLCTSPLFVFP